jgi:hypothetical protein
MDELRALKSATNGSNCSVNQQLEVRTLFEDAGFICRREPKAEIEIEPCSARLGHIFRDSFELGRLRTQRWIGEHRTRGRLLSPKMIRSLALDQPRARMRTIALAANQSEPHISAWLNESERVVKLGLGFEPIGSLCELFRPQRGKLALLAGRVTGFVVFVLRHESESGALLMRFNAAEPYARGIWFDPPTLTRLRADMTGQMTDLFTAREFAANFCGAPVDGIVELDPRHRLPLHPERLLVSRLLGDSRLHEFDEQSPNRFKSQCLKTTIEARDLTLIWWSLVTMPQRAISVIDYPEGGDKLEEIEKHFGHGGDTTSKWQAGPRQKRAM